jgi:hypothetical protein
MNTNGIKIKAELTFKMLPLYLGKRNQKTKQKAQGDGSKRDGGSKAMG